METSVIEATMGKKKLVFIIKKITKTGIRRMIFWKLKILILDPHWIGHKISGI